MPEFVHPRYSSALAKITGYLKAFGVARSVKRSRSASEAGRCVFSERGTFIRPLQQRAEFERLIAMVTSERPRVLVEIGTGSGGGLLLFARAAAQDALIVSIDLPGGRFGGGYGHWRVPLYRTFAGPRQTLEFIRADSHASETDARLNSLLVGRRIDFLFIDGDHTDAGVAADFNRYGRFVRPGGLIAFHDIVEHAPETGCNVHRFWQRVKLSSNHMEIVQDWNAGFGGIGVITTPLA